MEKASEIRDTALLEKERNRNGKVMVVVPICKEYENGNIFRLLEGFSRQTAPSDIFELVMVVNNSPESRKNKDETFLDNQKTLQIGNFLATPDSETPLPDGLNLYRRSVLAKVKAKGLKIHMIDRTNGVKRNMGVLRNLGTKEAIGKLVQEEKFAEGIIAQLDADAVVESEYVQNIIDAFSDPNTESLFFHLERYIPQGDDTLFKTFWQDQFRTAYNIWNSTLRKGSYVDSSQIVARAQVYERLHGVPKLAREEDFALARKLMKKSKYRWDTDTSIYVSDRARAESFDGAGRMNPQLGELSCRSFRDYAFSEELVKILIGLIRHPDPSASQVSLQALFEQYRLPHSLGLLSDLGVSVQENVATKGNIWDLYFSIRNKVSDYFRRNGFRTTLDQETFAVDAYKTFAEQLNDSDRNVLDKLYLKLRHKSETKRILTMAAMRGVLQRIYGTGELSLDTLPAKSQEFLERNSWMVDKIKQLKGKYLSTDNALSKLIYDYPEFFRDFEASGTRKATITLTAIIQFIHTVQTHKDQFPSARTFLEKTGIL